MAKRKPKLICDLCAEEMDVIRIIPSAALLPELRTFRCNGCECLTTLEPDEIAARMQPLKPPSGPQSKPQPAPRSKAQPIKLLWTTPPSRTAG